MSDTDQSDTDKTVFVKHSRRFASNRFVYPVVSRRSKGVSVGVNLNPDKVCNFDCIYCQVDRRTESDQRFVEQPRLLEELRATLELCAGGEIFEFEPFQQVAPPLRRLNDIAFSGDGEPTTYRNFDELMGICAELKRQAGLDEVKMVLITNASMFHRPHVQRGLQILDENRGEIWAKLDAGTEEYYQLVDRTKFPFQQVLDNIRNAAQVRPLVIQSLFMTVSGTPPSAAEVDAYIERLREIVAGGGQIKLVQVYTVARQPAESYVGALSNQQVDEITERVRSEAEVPAESFYGVTNSTE